MKNRLKEKMLKGEKVLGTFGEIGNEIAMECLGYGGLDFAIIDTEHGPFGTETALNLIRAAKYTDITPLVRVKDGNRNSVLKMLDAGAMGLVIPNIHTVREVAEIVSYGKYYPVGERGVAPTAGTHFWTEDYAARGLAHYFAVSNRETLLLPQCETRGCLESIEEIVNMDGVDGIFIGPFDLSTALGKPGQLNDPEVRKAIEHVLQTCQEAEKFAFIYSGTEKDAETRFEMGFDAVAYGMDTTVLINTWKEIVARVKS